jgi:hypothetical protein
MQKKKNQNIQVNDIDVILLSTRKDDEMLMASVTCFFNVIRA